MEHRNTTSFQSVVGYSKRHASNYFLCAVASAGRDNVLAGRQKEIHVLDMLEVSIFFQTSSMSALRDSKFGWVYL